MPDRRLRCRSPVMSILPRRSPPPPAEQARIILSLERAIERERLRGMRRHWSYDLNRHIALKQALDSLAGKNAVARA